MKKGASTPLSQSFSHRTLRLDPIGIERAHELQEIYDQAPTYFRRVDGTEPLPGMALKDIEDTPPKRSESYIKVAALIYEGSKAIGYADLHVNHRARGMAYIGLLLLRDELHGNGYGRRSYQLVENYLTQVFGVEKIYLGVSDRNQVQPYWEKMGFIPNGFIYKWQGKQIESNVTEMEKVPLKVTLVEANISELKEICSLMQNTFGPNPKSEETFAKWIHDPKFHVTLARINGSLAGVAASYINSDPDLSKYELFGRDALEFLRNQKLGWFLTLAIAPEHRRQNIGWALAEEHSSWQRKQSCTAMVGSSWVTGSKDNSAHMFLKAGFQKLGESNEFLSNQLRGTGATCSSCGKTECECMSVLFGMKIEDQLPKRDEK